MNYIRRAIGGILILSAFAMGAEQNTPNPHNLGREVSLQAHLMDGQEFSLPLSSLLTHGKLLFNANWAEQEGGGRPLTKGTGRSLSDPSQPPTGRHSFNRLPRAHCS